MFKIFYRIVRRRVRRRTSKSSKLKYKQYKLVARHIVETKLELYNKQYNFSYNRIFIKNHSSRWGSCSKKGNLNFNYKIALLPDHLANYIVVHELCHLKEFNHSRAFWEEVAKAIPDFRKCKQELHRYKA